MNFTVLFDLVQRVIDLANYLFSLINHKFVIGRFAILGIELWSGLTFTLWQAVLGAGGGMILIFLTFRFFKLFVPTA